MTWDRSIFLFLSICRCKTPKMCAKMSQRMVSWELQLREQLVVVVLQWVFGCCLYWMWLSLHICWAHQQNQATHLHTSTPPTSHHPNRSWRKESTRTETPKDSSKDKAIDWCFVCLSTSSALNIQPVAFFPKDLAETHAAANEGISKKVVANLRWVLITWFQISKQPNPNYQP